MKKLILVSLIFACSTANAQLYKCMKDGKITVGDQPCPKGESDLAPKKLTPPPKKAVAPVANDSVSSQLKTYQCSYNERSYKPCLPDSQVKVSVKDSAVAMCVARLKLGLKDPYSAQVVRSVRGEPDTIKGELVRYYWVDINAKNSFGAFVGPTAYACLMNSDESKIIFAGTDLDAVKMTDPIP